MYSRTLKLDLLHLTSPRDKSRLNVHSSVTLRIPTTIAPLHASIPVNVLTSGNFWIGRGVGCYFDFVASVDGKCPDDKTRLYLLDKIGRRLCDAPLWRQLQLTASLDTSGSYQEDELLFHFTIQISHAAQQLDSAAGLDFSSHSNTDCNPPEDIPCIWLERIHICLEILSPKSKPISHLVGKPDYGVDENANFEDSILLDIVSNHTDDYLEELEQTVCKMSETLSGSVAACFQRRSPISRLDLLYSVHLKSDQSLTPILPQRAFEKVKYRKDWVSTIEKQRILQEWVQIHYDKPFPATGEKDLLMRKTGYKRASLDKALRKIRRQLDASPQVGKDKSFTLSSSSDLTQGRETMDFANEPTVIRGHDDPQDSEMLFSEPEDISLRGNLISSAASNSWTNSQICISEVNAQSYVNGSPTCQSPDQTWPSICEMIVAAFNLVLAGNSRRPRHIQIQNAPPAIPLSILAPSIFCPFFKKFVTYNARFLPRMADAICGSLSRNAQGAGLKKKLNLLAESSIFMVSGEDSSELGSRRRFRIAVQQRMWAMMQRKLYDPAATRDLYFKAGDESIALTEDEDDLLFDLEDRDGLLGAEMRLDDDCSLSRQELIREHDDFEDLLVRTDYNGPYYSQTDFDIERERLDIERQTDEMLFGNEWDAEFSENEGDELLLDKIDSEGLVGNERGDEVDSMLV